MTAAAAERGGRDGDGAVRRATRRSVDPDEDPADTARRQLLRAQAQADAARDEARRLHAEAQEAALKAVETRAAARAHVQERMRNTSDLCRRMGKHEVAASLMHLAARQGERQERERYEPRGGWSTKL
mmetsp:Transcript_32378/g.84576  ORF Transcript_32378/g.84576 Transcript_32378/m.84576 type:complete len:128 (+) Transcript_32378:3-386(+)